jgi:hypothetical protein
LVNFVFWLLLLFDELEEEGIVVVWTVDEFWVVVGVVEEVDSALLDDDVEGALGFAWPICFWHPTLLPLFVPLGHIPPSISSLAGPPFSSPFSALLCRRRAKNEAANLVNEPNMGADGSLLSPSDSSSSSFVFPSSLPLSRAIILSSDSSFCSSSFVFLSSSFSG